MSALVIANTQIRRDEAGRFCLNDLHQASGAEKRHQPANWLRMDKTADLVSEIEDFCEDVPQNRGTQPAVVTIQGGAVQGTYAVKELVYAYAMWISAKFHLHVIRAYDAMVTAKPAAESVLPRAASHYADVLVSASRGFNALVKAGRVMGMGRPEAVRAANRATAQATGVNLVDELEAEPLLATARLGAAGSTLDTVGLFHQALQAGELDAPYQPCLSRDAFYLYQHWCTTQGYPPDHMPRFIHRLRVEQGVRVERKRYTTSEGTFGPVAMLMWGKVGCTSGEISHSVVTFQRAVQEVLKA